MSNRAAAFAALTAAAHAAGLSVEDVAAWAASYSAPVAPEASPFAGLPALPAGLEYVEKSWGVAVRCRDCGATEPQTRGHVDHSGRCDGGRRRESFPTAYPAPAPVEAPATSEHPAAGPMVDGPCLARSTAGMTVAEADKFVRRHARNGSLALIASPDEIADLVGGRWVSSSGAANSDF